MGWLAGDDTGSRATHITIENLARRAFLRLSLRISVVKCQSTHVRRVGSVTLEHPAELPEETSSDPSQQWPPETPLAKDRRV
jgi:hypothetical protein